MSKFSTLGASTKQSVFQWIAAFGMGALLLSSTGLAAIIYDNGGLATGSNSGSGVAAPAGTQWSEAPNDFGVTNAANTTAGYSCAVTATLFRCADDFNVPVGQTWTINQVIVFAYQTGFAGATSPITGATLRIWNGRPSDPGSAIVFGDTTTNRLASSTDSLFFRIFNSVVGVGAGPPSVPGTTRRIWQTAITVSPAAVLPAGNYWIDWNTTIGTTTAHFAPPSTFLGTRAVPFNNGRQFTGTVWTDASDAGQFPTGAPTPITVRQDFPFKLDGMISGAPAIPRSRTLDFDGDNKTDLAVVRSATGASQTTWWIQNSNGGSIRGVDWGIGAGFGSGDRVTPADFDGDGKTDVAVWRPIGAIPAFYILNSATNTASVVSFGLANDNPSVVGDYDGDGKADPAVYRTGVTPGSQSTFYYRGSLNNPSGNITFVPWGISGDRPIHGDFDGDGKFDFHVARDSGGSAIHYRLINGSMTPSFFDYGLTTDRFVSGDFDADGRADLAAVRSNSGVLDWYVLMSATNLVFVEKFGAAPNDYLTPGDYDGDGKMDLSVWRSGAAASDTKFYNRNTGSSPQAVLWGISAGGQSPPDYPVANFNVH
ncbi:MAG: VCBS repeat-containing protein [Acidobacteriota bacterium]